MKIAVFTDVYTPSGSGGIVSSIRAQKAELESLGHEVTVFCPGLKTNEKNVVLVPTRKNLKISGAVLAENPTNVKRFILKKYPNFGEDFDLVHVHYEAACSLAGIQLAKEFDLPLVQTMHGREDMAITLNVGHPVRHFVAASLMLMHKKALPHSMKVKKDKFQAPTHTRAKMWQIMVNHAEAADVVTTPADHFAKKLEHYGVTRPIVVVPNGIPESLVERDFSERKFTDGDVLKMIWSSRISNEKRILPFLEAVAQIKRPYVLYIYGGGNAEKKAKKFAKEHQLKAKFFGSVPREKIIARMQEAHLSVLTSYNFDTQGMVLIEAEATGLPVFFCDPTLMEIVPRDSFILAGGPEPSAMAIALDNFAPDQISKMSHVMLKHRREVLQSSQIKKLLGAYALAIKLHKKSTSKKS